MKRIIEHPPEPQTGRTYWRSLDELADKPEFRHWLEKEFPAGIAELETDGLTRRSFLRLMGASMALAGLSLAGCRRPEAHVVPYTKSPEWLVPGKTIQYATCMPRRRGALPLLATCVDGRPIKLEGNDSFPGGNGATDVHGQTAILDLYDPDRSKKFLKDGEETDAKEFWAQLDAVRKRHLAARGEGLAILAESSTSPTRNRLRGALAGQMPQMTWAVYEPVSNAAEMEATLALTGTYAQFLPDYEKADLILSLDCDFLGQEEGGVEAVRGFAAGRRRVDEEGKKMSRLYVVESRFSLTGGMADHRFRIASSLVSLFAIKLTRKLIKLGVTGLTDPDYPGRPELEIDPTDWMESLARDMVANKGRVLVVAGAHQPASVHAMAYMLNSALGANGQTYSFTVPLQSNEDLAADLTTNRDLFEKINSGKIETLVVLGGNPAYNLPADYDWAALRKKVPNLIRLGYYEDETSEGAQWHAPAAHFLESWGDARSRNGAYMVHQPMILPLFGGVSELEVLAALAGMPRPEGPSLVKETFALFPRRASLGLDHEWHGLLHGGHSMTGATGVLAVSLNGTGLAGLMRKYPVRPLAAGEYELVLYPCPKVDDGRYNNNGWLQELPDPISKLTWDNALLVSPAAARKLGLLPETFLDGEKENLTDVNTRAEFKMARVTADGRDLECPVLVLPGLPDQTVCLALGYGRKKAGRVGKGTGVSAYNLRTSAQPWIITSVSLQKISRTYPLAVTQEHSSMEGRGLVREATLEHYRKDPEFVQSIGVDSHQPGYPNYQSAYEHPKLDDPMQWGMVIDLNTCVGCNACMVACQAENNIPIVGKEQVMRGREMHWIRNDRYFSSTSKGPEAMDEPQMLIQPVACMQCENAPCETVCPVNATVHSNDGLNVMAYNRCIGTRYCANNCPYKVRRFNYFNYNERPLDKLYLGPLAKKGADETVKMQKNPNVTVRMRGVMEKCTYCIQRIEAAKIDQRVKARDSKDIVVKADSFKTACQQVCPAESIVFGDINQPESKVSKARRNPRNYGLLAYLNTRPRTSYLGRVRNVNPEMPDAAKVGHSSEFGHHGGGHGHGAPPRNGHDAHGHEEAQDGRGAHGGQH
jgi:molybdopterin-containing oxidoreductase family iron-sulfur binding subunit